MSGDHAIILRARDGSVRAVSYVSAADVADISSVRWKLSTGGYAVRNFWRDGKLCHEAMARRILGVTDPAVTVDHINGDKLDNRRENLRIASGAENRCNKKLYSNNTSGFKGVEYRPDCRGRFRATIKRDGTLRYLGWFDTAEDAARAYNTAALEIHGEFARLNVVP